MNAARRSPGNCTAYKILNRIIKNRAARVRRVASGERAAERRVSSHSHVRHTTHVSVERSVGAMYIHVRGACARAAAAGCSRVRVLGSNTHHSRRSAGATLPRAGACIRRRSTTTRPLAGARCVCSIAQLLAALDRTWKVIERMLSPVCFSVCVDVTLCLRHGMPSDGDESNLNMPDVRAPSSSAAHRKLYAPSVRQRARRWLRLRDSWSARPPA